MLFLVCVEFESLFDALEFEKVDLFTLQDGGEQIDAYVKEDTGAFVFKSRGIPRFDVYLTNETGRHLYQAPQATMGSTNIQRRIIDRFRAEKPERKVHWIVVKGYQ